MDSERLTLHLDLTLPHHPQPQNPMFSILSHFPPSAFANVETQPQILTSKASLITTNKQNLFLSIGNVPLQRDLCEIAPELRLKIVDGAWNDPIETHPQKKLVRKLKSQQMSIWEDSDWDSIARSLAASIELKARKRVWRVVPLTKVGARI